MIQDIIGVEDFSAHEVRLKTCFKFLFVAFPYLNYRRKSKTKTRRCPLSS